MGFLDRLRGGGDAEIAVSLDPPEALPGEEVLIRLDVSGGFDEKARGIRVTLEGTGSYLVKERDRDADGDTRTRTVRRSVSLDSQAVELPLALGPAEVRLVVPPGAPPSSRAVVDWTVHAVVDRERGLDERSRVELPVKRPPGEVPAGPLSPEPVADGLRLAGVPAAVAEGGELTGTLVVEVPEDVKCSAVRVRLHRRCTYQAEMVGDGVGTLRIGSFQLGSSESRITESSQVVEVDLDGKREFAAGRREQYDFTIGVPVGHGATTEHPHALVEWVLEGVLDRRMRGDVSVEAPVVVH